MCKPLRLPLFGRLVFGTFVNVTFIERASKINFFLLEIDLMVKIAVLQWLNDGTKLCFETKHDGTQKLDFRERECELLAVVKTDAGVL